MGAGDAPPPVPEKACHLCGAKAPVFALVCPVCGREWFPGASKKARREPARKILLPLAVALAAALLAFCLLYVLALRMGR